MKNLTFAKLMMIVMMAILPMSFFAQKKQNLPVERYFYIFADGGLSINHTDLANYGFIPFVQNGKFVANDGYVFKNFDGEIGLGYQLGKVIGINGRFGTGTLGGEKHSQMLTPINGTVDYSDLQLVKTTFMEANLNLTFNLTNLFFGYNPRRVFNFIPHIGIGGIRYHAGAVNQLGEKATDPTTTLLTNKSDAEMTFTVPVGAELNFNVSRMLDIYLDYTFNWAGNDKLDQVQKVFYPEGAAGKRVIDDIQVVNDMYSHLNLGLRLKFNKKPCDIETMAANADQITMRSNPDPLEEHDGQVCFDVIFTVPANYFEKEAVMNITPTITYNGGQVVLDPVTFVGQSVNTANADFQVNYKAGGEFTKHYCTAFVPEMESGKLMGNPMFYVYNGTIYPTQDEIVKNTYFTQGGDRVITDGVIVSVVKCEVDNVKAVVSDNSINVSWNGNAESYDVFMGQEFNNVATVTGVQGNRYVFENVEPGDYVVYVKANCKKGATSDWQGGATATVQAPRLPIAIFYFDYNSSNLKANTKMNKEAIKAIAAYLAAGNTIEGFEVEGWASPEGELELNNNLANERAAAADKAIKAQLKKVKLNEKNFTFSAQGFGPDWNKFIELVQASNIADKDQIVRVIQNSKNREQEIKNMINVYPELEKDILPLIRRAEVFVK